MLETALAFGADAVDAGQPRYSLRVRNHSFHDKTALGVGIEYAHSRDRLFCAVSIISYYVRPGRDQHEERVFGWRPHRVHPPRGNLELTIATMQGKDGTPVEVAPGSGHRVSTPLPSGYEGAFVNNC